MKWRNGALGTMAVTMLTYQKYRRINNYNWRKRYSKNRRTAVNKIEYWHFKDNDELVPDLKNLNYEIQNVYGEAIRHIM